MLKTHRVPPRLVMGKHRRLGAFAWRRRRTLRATAVSRIERVVYRIPGHFLGLAGRRSRSGAGWYGTGVVVFALTSICPTTHNLAFSRSPGYSLLCLNSWLVGSLHTLLSCHLCLVLSRPCFFLKTTANPATSWALPLSLLLKSPRCCWSPKF